MKKCYFILGLILATSTAVAKPDKNMADLYRRQLTDLCWEMMTENGPIDREADAKKFCKKVANCVVDNAPGNFSLQNPQYMEPAYLNCLATEARKFMDQQ